MPPANDHDNLGLMTSEYTHLFILAGGSGERFWPWSRSNKPKHLLKLFSAKTLLEETAERCQLALPHATLHIQTNISQIETIRQEAPAVAHLSILAEPAKRDTAPACALATALARSIHGEKAVVILTPADARIVDTLAFSNDIKMINQAAANQDAILTIGIPPTHPATGYGYLRLGAQISKHLTHVDKFVEKPDLATAQKFITEGGYLWNAGIFAWRAEVFIKEAHRQQPLLAKFIENFPSDNLESYINENFCSLPKISVDYAICENANNVLCVPATFDWDDVGTWTALRTHLAHDPQGNILLGEATALECTNTIIAGGQRHIAACGLENFIIADTSDALLVCPATHTHLLKELVSRIPPNLR